MTERSSVLHRYEMSTSLKKQKSQLLLRLGRDPSQCQHDVAVATELLWSSATGKCVGTGASTEVGNVQ